MKNPFENYKSSGINIRFDISKKVFIFQHFSMSLFPFNCFYTNQLFSCKIVFDNDRLIWDPNVPYSAEVIRHLTFSKNQFE